MLVRIIPTGRAELLGFQKCLERLFPNHTFEVVKERDDENDRPVPYPGFTSARLAAPPTVGTNIERLISQLAADVYPGRLGRAADLAILIDDLELENADQPEVVIETVRTAAKEHIDKIMRERGAKTADHVAFALQNKASFHLAAPMIESWFFADSHVLPSANVPPARLPPRLRAGTDPEQFDVDEPLFSSDDGAHCVALEKRNQKGGRRKPEMAPWVLKPRPNVPAFVRERHPKAYLSWLCRDSEDDRCSTYRESKHGAEALAAIDFSRMLANTSFCRYARALVYDLADALGPPSVLIAPGEEHPLVSRSASRQSGVLRNI
jgi:hypothetical protein